MTVNDSESANMALSSEDIAQERVTWLREVFPEVFSEGKVDFETLRAMLGDVVSATAERYGISWPGKSEALRQVQTSSNGTLRPARGNSVRFDETSNVIIEGDNLEALKLLQKAYYGQIKAIYIDPPYNTGHEFIYPDNFHEGLQDYLRYSGQIAGDGIKLSTNTETDGRFHSKWLSMMWPRLYVARTLLREDGAVWISIDDNEMPNLRAICNEIFGEENFVATFVWQKRTTRENRRVFSFNHDYVVCYARSKDHFQASRNMLPLTEEALARYENPDDDKRGPWQSVSLNAQAGHATASQFYSVTTPGGRVVDPPPGRCWSVTEPRMKELIADNRVWFGKDGNNVPREKIFLSEAKDGLTPHTLWTADEVGTNDSAKKQLIELFDGKTTFDTPKPVQLLNRIVGVSTGKDSGDVVLDFFAGSGTTGEAVMRANREDGGNRRFILVQLPEPVDIEGYATLSEICIDRVRRAGERISQAKQTKIEGSDSDTGFRVFRLGASNFRIWDSGTAPSAAESLSEQLRLYADNLHEDAASEAVLFELLLKAGFSLTDPIASRELKNGTAFVVANGLLIVTLADIASPELLREIMELAPQRVIALDAAFKGNDQLKTNMVLEMRSRGIEFRTV